jgi:hypothetical protein
MRRLEISDREIMQIALRNEILRSEEARYDHRLHGVLLVSQGISCYKVLGVLLAGQFQANRLINRRQVGGERTGGC